MAHRPKTAYEASQLAHEYEGTHNFSKRYLSGRSYGNHSYQPTYHSKREQSVSSSGVASTNGSSSGSKAVAVITYPRTKVLATIRLVGERVVGRRSM